MCCVCGCVVPLVKALFMHYIVHQTESADTSSSGGGQLCVFILVVCWFLAHF